MNSNENAYGPSVKVVEVMKSSIGSANRYPRMEYNSLAERIATASRVKPEQVLCAEAKAVLAAPGGPADIVQFAILNHIGSEFRNGKIHPRRGNPRIFTDRREMQRARKLILGIDEERVDLPVPLLNRIRFVEGLADSESKEIEKRLSEGWAGFPGLVTLLWQAFGQTQTTRSA